MGILDKILGRDRRPEGVPPETAPETECPHTSLVPHWDNPEDMGKDDRAHYRCEACGAQFDYDVARQFLEHPPAALAGTQRDR